MTLLFFIYKKNILIFLTNIVLFSSEFLSQSSNWAKESLFNGHDWIISGTLLHVNDFCDFSSAVAFSRALTVSEISSTFKLSMCNSLKTRFSNAKIKIIISIVIFIV